MRKGGYCVKIMCKYNKKKFENLDGKFRSSVLYWKQRFEHINEYIAGVVLWYRNATAWGSSD